jgi:F-type H+-transporting ATPase subunit delta
MQKKEAIALEIFKNFSPVSKNIIRLVIKQGRESQLKNIAQEFINKVEDIKGTQVSLWLQLQSFRTKYSENYC